MGFMDEGPIFSRLQPEDARQVRRAVRTGRLLLILVLIAAISLSVVSPYTEYLWYLQDARQPQVILKGYQTRGTLFMAAFLISWAFVWLNFRQALRVTLVFLNTSPTSAQEAALSNLVKWLQAKGSSAARFVSPILAFFLASSFSNDWNKLLLFQNSQPFGVKDPTFGLDISFFVFQLPWWQAVVGYLVGLTAITAVVTLGLYVGLQALASLAKIELSRPAFRWHVSGLLGLFFALSGGQSWLNSFRLGLDTSQQFTGAGHAAMQEYNGLRWVGMLSILVGIVIVVTVPKVRTYSVPIGGGLLVAVAHALLVWFVPSVVQQLVVSPNRLAMERPYAEKAIQMTRFAYQLDQIQTRDFGARQNPTPKEVSDSMSTLQDLRLWDPDIIQQSFEGIQALRPYYSFADVDIDRYDIDGKQAMVMLSPRDIDLDGLESGARNWINERLRYTHGYGLAMARVGESTSNGQPSFVVSDVPVETKLPLTEPRIYFSDYLDRNGYPKDEYAIVRTSEPEFDYEEGSGGSKSHRWTSDRGVRIGEFGARLAHAVFYAEPSLFFSKNITSESRLLRHRNVLERAYRIYPFLRLDADPYIVVDRGRLTWILDAYTTSNSVPYSSMAYGAGSLNYIRNSVKITIDAYSGETNAYAMDPREPLLRAYRSIYPGSIRDGSEFPAELRPHLRYPEDMLELQSIQLARYHVTDPNVFLSNSDAWEIASERDLSGQTAPVRPYYVQMRLPDEAREGFFQILPFSPRGRHTMSGWIAAHCDPETYGKLTLYRFTESQTVDGPGLMEGNFSSTPEISEINRQFNNDQSEILVGNLLVLPIGRSIVYSEALFLKSRTTGIQAVPRLFRVILALNNDRIVVGKDLQDALNKLFEGQSAPMMPDVPSEGTKVVDPMTQEARKALRALDEADAALRKGDFAKYGELQKKARRILEEIVD